MKKIWNIILIILGIGGLLLIAFTLFIATALGKRGDNYENNNREQIDSIEPIKETKTLKTDSIPQGQMTYQLHFAEFGGRITDQPIKIFISGNNINIYNTEKNPLPGEHILIEGVLLRHKSGKWIIAQSMSDYNADEVGGCTGVPTIDFLKKLIEWC